MIIKIMIIIKMIFTIIIIKPYNAGKLYIPVNTDFAYCCNRKELTKQSEMSGVWADYKRQDDSVCQSLHAKHYSKDNIVYLGHKNQWLRFGYLFTTSQWVTIGYLFSLNC